MPFSKFGLRAHPRVQPRRIGALQVVPGTPLPVPQFRSPLMPRTPEDAAVMPGAGIGAGAGAGGGSGGGSGGGLGAGSGDGIATTGTGEWLTEDLQRILQNIGIDIGLPGQGPSVFDTSPPASSMPPPGGGGGRSNYPVGINPIEQSRLEEILRGAGYNNPWWRRGASTGTAAQPGTGGLPSGEAAGGAPEIDINTAAAVTQAVREILARRQEGSGLRSGPGMFQPGRGGLYPRDIAIDFGPFQTRPYD